MDKVGEVGLKCKEKIMAMDIVEIMTTSMDAGTELCISCTAQRKIFDFFILYIT